MIDKKIALPIKVNNKQKTKFKEMLAGISKLDKILYIFDSIDNRVIIMNNNKPATFIHWYEFIHEILCNKICIEHAIDRDYNKHIIDDLYTYFKEDSYCIFGFSNPKKMN